MLDKLIILLALVAVAALSPVLADDHRPACFAGGHAGSGGLGLGGGCAVGSKLAVRLSVEGVDDSVTETIDGVEYDANGDVSFTRVQLDWFPTGSGFFVSGGFADTDLSVDGTADPTTPIQVGSVTVPPASLGFLEMTAAFDGVEPYLGLGYLWSVGSRFSIRSELGVSSMPDPDVTLVEQGSNFISDADIQQEIDDLLAEYDDELSLYPYLRIGLEFRFP